MKLVVITMDAYIPMLIQAVKELKNIELIIFSSKVLDDSSDELSRALTKLKKGDIILLYRSTERFWEEIDSELKDMGAHKPVICIGSNPLYWDISSVKLDIVSQCYDYVIYGGKENFKNLLLFLKSLISKGSSEVENPRPIPWEGIYHPEKSTHFTDIKEYLVWYRMSDRPMVGIVFSRSYWANENCEMIDLLIEELEKRNVGCIAVFTYSVKDENLGTKSSADLIEEYYFDENRISIIDSLIKLTPLFVGDKDRENISNRDIAERGADLYGRLNVPVFQPVISSYKTAEEWEKDPHGLGSLTSWYVTLPEFEGVIEPMILAAASEIDDKTTDSHFKKIIPIQDRCSKIAERVSRWISLRKKPLSERKIAFILHNKPCASLEGTVGGASNLDSLESVARILKRMRDAGYNVSPPESGEDLIDTIMERKAISEFRWTTVHEIVKNEGYLKLVSVEEYNRWFDTLSKNFKDKIIEVWGNPPGEEINGAPAAMVYDGKIVITGVQYGNAVVCVQPKRGCAGSICDGKACRILHNPDIPPPHQYFATYRYLEYDFNVDCIVHVGTHGNIEFLPGKGVGLSKDCSPDLAIGNIPHLYIYNSDNPPEGAIAKRRSYATLVDHMQSVMIKSGISQELEEIEKLLGEYYQAKDYNKTRAHSIEHLIIDAIHETNLIKEIKYTEDMPFSEVVERIHEAISLIKSSQMNDGLHIFGDIPADDRRIEYIRSIFNADTDNGLTLRSSLFELLGIDLSYALNHQGEYYSPFGIPFSQVLEYVDDIAVAFIKESLKGREKDGIEIVKNLLGDRIKSSDILPSFSAYHDMVKNIDWRIENSKEIDSLLSGFDGKYIPAGPSGKITRGRYDILPSGRNFYTLDVRTLPTKAAYKVGTKLAVSVIDKHVEDNGDLPENVAIYWTCMDITCADGEGMAQIMSLVGARPVWDFNGRVTEFEIIPLKELGRPRIDVTIRIGGINRDTFPECINYIDNVIRSVASLDEPEELNFVRKHSLEQLNKKSSKDKKLAWQESTTRIFGSKPGTYMAGVNLAVYASAWKDEQDLTDIFIYWNQYAYGDGIFGKESSDDLVNNLKSVDITFNKTYTDEYDIFGCCCYFATHGGMTAAARNISGKEVKVYYGDTRDVHNVGVRELGDEVRRVVRSKLLNPNWIEGMKKHGYKGLGDVSKMIGRVYGWEATTEEVDDWIFDDITRSYVLDKEMRENFERHNPWALEEIGRRLLEAEQRGLWNADPEVLSELKNAYIEVESWLEDRMGDVEGDFQGGAVNIITAGEVEEWHEKIKNIRHSLGR